MKASGFLNNINGILNFILKFFYLFINIISVFLIIIIYVIPNDAIRVILAIPFLFFISGFVWISALFPKRTALNGVARTVLSVSLSIIILVFVGISLNYTPWGIKLNTVVVALTSLVLVGSLTAFYYQNKVPPTERIELSVKLVQPNAPVSTVALYLLLAFVIIASAAVIGDRLINPKSPEKFTEFYLLDQNGKTVDYPGQIRLGQDINLVIGIINHEKKDINYRIEVRINGTNVVNIGPFLIKDNEKWEQPFNYTTTLAGEKQFLDFYALGDNQPTDIEPLKVWFSVLPP